MDGLSYHQKAFPNLVNNYELIISFSSVPIETYFVPPNTWFRVYSGSLLIICRLCWNTQTPKASLHHDIGVHVCDLWKLFMAFFFKFFCYDQIFYQYLLGGINFVVVVIVAVIFLLMQWCLYCWSDIWADELLIIKFSRLLTHTRTTKLLLKRPGPTCWVCPQWNAWESTVTKKNQNKKWTKMIKKMGTKQPKIIETY